MQTLKKESAAVTIRPEKGSQSPDFMRRIYAACTSPPVLFAGVLAIVVAAHLSVLLPGTLFITDEAFYLGSGVEIFMTNFAGAGSFHPYTTGSIYIFPLIAAIVGAVSDHFGIAGLLGIRLLNILINTAAAGFVYRMSRVLADRWLRNPSARKWMPPSAALVFGLSGSVLYIGTLATYDALSIAFLAFGIWRLVHAVLSPEGTSPERESLPSGTGFGRIMDAGIAGVAVSLCMITRYYPLIFTPLIILMALVSVCRFGCDLAKHRRRNKAALLLMVFTAFFLLAFGSYLYAFSIQAVIPALKWNQKNVDSQSAVPPLKLIAYVFRRHGTEALLSLAGAIWLAVPPIKRGWHKCLAFISRHPNRRGIAPPLQPATDILLNSDPEQNWIGRLFQSIPFLLIPVGGIAFQVVVTHNYFAYPKNLAFPILAMSPLAGFMVAKLIEQFPRRFRWMFWIVLLGLSACYAIFAIEQAKAYQISGGLHSIDPVPFISRQIGVPSFALHYADFQNRVVSIAGRVLPYLAAVFIVLTGSWIARRFMRNNHGRSGFAGVK